MSANFRLLHVAPTGNLALEDVVLKGGYLTGLNNDNNAGAALLVKSGGKVGSILNTRFEDNHAVRGAAIHVSGLSATIELITGSTFTQNESEDIGTISILGGGSINEISSTNFISNTNDDGGAIALRGQNPNVSQITLIEQCEFIENISVKREEGAAIRAEFRASIGTIKNSLFKENIAGFGGAISLNNTGTINAIEDCTFLSNYVESSSFSPVGGAIFILGSNPPSGIELITGCSFINNEARAPSPPNMNMASGGAIHAVLAGSYITISNSTFYDNKAQNGGAISMSTGSSLENLSNTTITNNNGSTAGGGLRVNSSTITRVSSNIIANNSSPSGPDIITSGTGVLSTSTFNLIGVDNGHTITNVDGNQVGTIMSPLDPLFVAGGPQDNGGPTLTIALQDISPAVDAGENILNLIYDQRGAPFPRISSIAPDIGAFEVDLTPDSNDETEKPGNSKRRKRKHKENPLPPWPHECRLMDSDGDLVNDCEDKCPLNPNKAHPDQFGCSSNTEQAPSSELSLKPEKNNATPYWEKEKKSQSGCSNIPTSMLNMYFSILCLLYLDRYKRNLVR